MVKHGIDVGGGVINRNYKGKMGVVLFNHDQEKMFTVCKGDWVAQIIFKQIDNTPMRVTNKSPPNKENYTGDLEEVTQKSKYRQ